MKIKPPLWTSGAFDYCLEYPKSAYIAGMKRVVSHKSFNDSQLAVDLVFEDPGLFFVLTVSKTIYSIALPNATLVSIN